MATRENAYLKYLLGQGGKLTEESVDPNDLAQFQSMSNLATRQGGRLNYADYPAGSEQFRHTVGRTGEGDIQRQGNTYNISEVYDFNPKTQSGQNRLQGIGRALGNFDPLSALGYASTFVGKDLQTDIKIPVGLEQRQEEGEKLPFNPGNTVIGGQSYSWQPYQLKPGESWEDVARESFAGNQYKPEGENLTNYANWIIQQNKGNKSNIIYRPVANNQSQQNPLNSVGEGVSSLFGGVQQGVRQAVSQGVSQGIPGLFGSVRQSVSSLFGG